jgi:hypothetical protein
MAFSGGNVGVVTKDVGEAPRGEGVGENGFGGVPSCRRMEKSCENAPELIGCIFQGLGLSVVASSNINLLASFSTLKNTLAFYLLQKYGQTFHIIHEGNAKAVASRLGAYVFLGLCKGPGAHELSRLLLEFSCKVRYKKYVQPKHNDLIRV